MVLISANTTSAVLASLRQLMVLSTITPTNLSAYIVPFVDPHRGENVALCDERLKFISGFTGVGSTGFAVITMDKAILWTDSRYTIRAANELDENWEVQIAHSNVISRIGSWLAQNLVAGDYVGFDPILFEYSSWKSMSYSLHSSGKYMIPVERNLIGVIWESQGRPPCTRNPIISYDLKYAGKPTWEKVYDLRMSLRSAGVMALIISELDEIAWLLNLRGNDIQYDPTFPSYVLLTTRNTFQLFVYEDQLDDSVKEILKSQIPEIQFKDYEKVLDAIDEFGLESTGLVMFNDRTSYAIGNLIPDFRQKVVGYTPISSMKAEKNQVELENMGIACIKDAAAICQLFSWIENSLNKNIRVTEISASRKLDEFRMNIANYLKSSIETMSASGPNAALALYQPREETNRELNKNEIYLLEAGGQYFEGTTDQSRTIHFGSPTAEEKDRYTRLLKGQIEMQSTIFTMGTSDNKLEDIAYRYLYEIDIGTPSHATGHGVGSFLFIEEGPSSIGSYFNEYLRANMIMTNEPGVYSNVSGYGIRNENVMKIKKVSDMELGFDVLTFLPYQQKLMDFNIMTVSEVKQINEYHRNVREVIGTFITENRLPREVYNWLVKETEPIDVSLIPTTTTTTTTTTTSTTPITITTTTTTTTQPTTTTTETVTEVPTTEEPSTWADSSSTESLSTQSTIETTTEIVEQSSTITELTTTESGTTEEIISPTTPNNSNSKCISVTTFIIITTVGIINTFAIYFI